MNVKFINHEPDVLKAMEQSIDSSLEVVGLVAEGYAKRLCPVDTGRLRNSISHTVRGSTAYIGTNVEYAAYVEMGTERTSPQPYLKPAVANHANEYRKIIEEYIKGK